METHSTCASTNTRLSKRTWFCSLCDENMNVNGKVGLIDSNFHKRKERFAFSVKQYGKTNPEFFQTKSIYKDVIKDCEHKFFHNFEYRCKYDKKLAHSSSVKVFYFTNLNDFRLSLFQTKRFCKKTDEYEKDRYNFEKTIKITIKANSNRSYISISNYSNLRIPKLHVEFFRKLSENPQSLPQYLNEEIPSFIALSNGFCIIIDRRANI